MISRPELEKQMSEPNLSLVEGNKYLLNAVYEVLDRVEKLEQGKTEDRLDPSQIGFNKKLEG